VRLKDKVIIVTGGTYFIGDAIAAAALREGDKVFVYPTIVRYDKVEKVSKKGVVTIKEIPVTGLKCAEDYNNDANVEKLVDRVYATVLVFSNVVGKDFFTDYSLVKNKHLLEQLK
jgi:NAD(P)-dependent dehydrogenase (short-subunit alcohol dehydrogenase family)